MEVQEELDRVPCWICPTTYTNSTWSVCLFSMITRPITKNYIYLT